MKRIRNVFFFCAMIAATVFILKMLNFVPLSIRSEGLKKYRTVDDVRAELGLKKLFLPAFFPQHLSWPPAEIHAQKKPFLLVMMHFRDRNSGKVVLAIRQADAADPSPLKSRIEPEGIHGREQILIKGRQGELVYGPCPDGRICNALSWQEEGFIITVVEKGLRDELVRIAESMLPAAAGSESLNQAQ